MNINENVFIQFGQLMTYQGTLGAISGIHCHSGGQSGISGSLRCCQEHYGQAQNLICLCQSRILFSKYLRTLKSHRNGFVFKICVWILVFRRKKRFKNPIFCCRDICKINTAPLFLKHPVVLHQFSPLKTIYIHFENSLKLSLVL